MYSIEYFRTSYLIRPDQIRAQIFETSEQGSRILPLCGEMRQGWSVCIQGIGSLFKFIKKSYQESACAWSLCVRKKEEIELLSEW